MSASSYRPITDTWILARAKLTGGHKYYGAYPGGFPERARVLLGVNLSDPVLHVCAGKVRHYPYKNAIGIHDRTLDLDASLSPYYLQDAREPYPLLDGLPWPAILMDPPYSEIDAERYTPGPSVYPTPNLLLKNALAAVRPGGRVGLLHYVLPQPPASIPCRFVACVSVYVGFNNRVRCFSVFERLEMTG